MPPARSSWTIRPKRWCARVLQGARPLARCVCGFALALYRAAPFGRFFPASSDLGRVFGLRLLALRDEDDLFCCGAGRRRCAA